MKTINSVTAAAVSQAGPAAKRTERPISLVAFMADGANPEEETAPVGSATDGGRRNRPDQPERQAGPPKPETAAAAPAAKPGQAIGSPPLIAGNSGALAALLQLQEEEAEPIPRKPVDPDADW